MIQKLIEKPLLYLKRKFDIRCWVLLNSSDGRVYVYREQYVRTSSKEYIPVDPDNPNEDHIFMQLTNNAIQKDGEDYGKFEEGNIISMPTLFSYITSIPEGQGKTKEELQQKFQNTINDLICDTIKSVKGKIFMQRHTFELLGYDFIIDEDLNMILIEVNTNPCLEESNRLLRCLLPRMIDDLFCIVMDPIFCPNSLHFQQHYSDSRQPSKFPLSGDVFGSGHSGYSDSVNLWEHAFTMEQ